MSNTATATKEQLKGIFNINLLQNTTYKITITPISEEEADEIEFKSLKGIAEDLLIWMRLERKD